MNTGSPNAQLLLELKSLRPGRGLADAVDGATIPNLRAVNAIDLESGDELRAKLDAALAAAVQGLSDDGDRHLVTVALNLAPHGYGDTFNARLERLAGTLRLTTRHVQRKIDNALGELAERLCACRWVPETDWSVLYLDVLLRLDTTPPEAHERRTILAHVDGVHTIANRVDVPTESNAEPKTRLEILFGAVTATDTSRQDRSLVTDIVLPRPLHQGERHTYGQIVRADRIADRFACTPSRPHVRFALRVRFDPTRPPARVWRMDGVFTRQFDEPAASGEPLVPDLAGEVAAEFTNLRPGNSYGIQWQWH
ncbi:hypothetical protein [Actinokineospora inagensis]|uniref:hypothetical protein n=1 Tax=Actinokineospora inagensis TaxID=103730 RepID=UPI000418176C|nr:hypothetical protein [Actinokineospora inagensis]